MLFIDRAGNVSNTEQTRVGLVTCEHLQNTAWVWCPHCRVFIPMENLIFDGEIEDSSYEDVSVKAVEVRCTSCCRTIKVYEEKRRR